VIYAHNLISISRIAATPVVAALACYEQTRLVALVLAVVVGLSDAIDGPIARKTGGASRFGALLDMTSDKVYLCSMLAVLAALGRSPVWAAAIIASRELLVQSLRVVSEQHGETLPIVRFGKYKAFLLYVLVPLALTDVSRTWTTTVAAVACASGVVSLGEYIVRMRVMLAQEFFCRPQEEAADARDDD